MVYRNWNYDPDRTLDTGYGLVMRLNYLLAKADQLGPTGDMRALNFILDRILCNLLYKNPLEVTKDENGNIIDVGLSDEDKKVLEQLNKKVNEAIKLIQLAKTKEEYREANARFYQALLLKDVGLKKMMYSLKIYLRDTDRNPARSMWGG